MWQESDTDIKIRPILFLFCLSKEIRKSYLSHSLLSQVSLSHHQNLICLDLYSCYFSSLEFIRKVAGIISMRILRYFLWAHHHFHSFNLIDNHLVHCVFTMDHTWVIINIDCFVFISVLIDFDCSDIEFNVQHHLSKGCIQLMSSFEVLLLFTVDYEKKDRNTYHG